MFKHKIIKWIIAVLMALPIIPVGLVIWYLNHYSGINDLLRLYVAIILICVALASTFLGWYWLKKKSKIGATIMSIIACLMIVGNGYFSYVNMNIHSALNQMITTQSISYHSLVTMTDNEIHDVNNLNEMRIGMLNLADQEVVGHIESYLVENNLADNNEISRYDSPLEMVHDLYNKEIDAIIIGSNYKSLFLERDGFNDIETDTQVLDTITIEAEQIISPTSVSLIEEPFSILLVGIDTTEGIEDVGLADSLILATVNPQNLSVTMTSIPRDSYVPIPCYNYAKDKITHSNNAGTSCVIGAVENLFDIEIPYYVKINFSGLVELVDEIGGIEVNVPMAIEEQNSRRQFGEHLIRVEAGLQTLNGEQALALSRHRKTLINGDLGRASNQQLVLEGIINQVLKELNTVNEFLALLNVLGHNIETNLSINDMSSFVQYVFELVPTFKNGNPLDYIHLMSMVLSGRDESVMTTYYSFPLSVVIPYQGAITDARNLMLINLGRLEPVTRQPFVFNGFEENNTNWIQPFYNEIIESPTLPIEIPSPVMPQEILPSYEMELAEPEVEDFIPVPEVSIPEIGLLEAEIDNSQLELESELAETEPSDSAIYE